ncbi:MAG: hypothetical protein GY753_19040 [Gammaproteobacteria bacterium]|nr:hypothetical protein [Gammaproteobacteria bacterium]
MEEQEEIELQEFLLAFQLIEADMELRQMNRIMQVHPARIHSSIFKTTVFIGSSFKKIDIYVSIALDFIPGIGWLKGLAEAYTGRDLITGDEIPDWARGVIAVVSFLPFARGSFKIARRGRRLVGSAGKAGTLALRKYGQLALLAYRLKSRVDPLKLYATAKKLSEVSSLTEKNFILASRIPAGRALTKVEKAATADVAKTFAVLEAEANRLSRTATGVIENGVSLIRTKSGTILPKKAPVAKQVAAGVAKNVSVVLQGLTKQGYSFKAIKALEAALGHLDDVAIKRLVSRLIKLKKIGRFYCELFHRCYGFDRIMVEFASKSSSKYEGAKFVMRVVLSRGDILKKVRVDPSLILFEWGVGKLTTVKGVERVAREVDIVVKGSRSLGVASTRYMELKNWTLRALNLWWAEKSISKQFARDVAILDPKNVGNIRWVFNSAKIAKNQKHLVVQFFVDVIQKDEYLKKVWGTDIPKIRSILGRMIIMQ